MSRFITALLTMLLLLALHAVSGVEAKSGSSAKSPGKRAQGSNPLTKRGLGFHKNKVMVFDSMARRPYQKGLPVVVVVDKKNFKTYMFQRRKDDRVYMVYRCENAIGTDDTPTPPGPYRVLNKTKWPSWIPPKSIDPRQKAVHPYNKDRKNPLGVARVRLNKFGIALHGTNNPGRLGQAVSHGCIRHENDDIVRIFNAVKRGTTVIIAGDLPGTVISRRMFASAK